MTDDRELSALMRDALNAEARQLSADTALTERMILAATAAQVSQPEPRRGWQAWVLPAAAAVLVALLVSSALLGGKLLHSSPTHPISSVSPLPLRSTASPNSTAPTPRPSSSPSGTASAVNPAPTGPAGGPVPAGFRAVDLTWISAEQGWALGTAPCATAPCTSIVRTTDGGTSWVGIHAPVAEFFGSHSCAANCLTSLRFASPLVGYAFGPSALYLTTDGGDHWVRQAGNAYALEISDGNVLRVTDGSRCGIFAGCAFKVQRADIGSTSWQDVTLPVDHTPLVNLSLVRNGSLAVITTFGHVSGGATNARSTLYVSTDGGSNWTLEQDPCPNSNGVEYDTRASTAAADGSLTVLCARRQPGAAGFTMTSTDGGQDFVVSPANLPGTDAGLIGAASSKTWLVAAGGSLYRSADGGAHWSQLYHGPNSASYIGFESGTVGRVIGAPVAGVLGSATIWTTTDAGQSWAYYTFH